MAYSLTICSWYNENRIYMRFIYQRKTNCNANVILIKAGISIRMTDVEDYKEVCLCNYQKLIGKLMYLTCGI